MALKYPGNYQKLKSLSIIEEGDVKKIRMANLSIIGSNFVNGVAKLHSDLLKTTIFKDFYEMFPNKFTNMTNGVTPRRWVKCANPSLALLYDRVLDSDEWLRNMDLLKKLERNAVDP